MNEPTKTLAFVGAALISVLAAIATRPSSGDYDPSDQLGQQLAEAFATDDAKRMSITRFDEATATTSSFEVAEQDGVWTLPSKGGYPADADRQLAEAVTGVTDREILLIASQDPNDHAEYGVVDPASSKLEPGQTGVGTRVTLSKGDGERLVDLIVGNEVKDQPEQRYVRRGEQDVVFVAEIDPSKFSTDFADWIEDDLLKINPWDIQGVKIRDYTAEFFLTLQGPQADLTYRNEIELAYDDGETDNKWSLTSLQAAADPKAGEMAPAELGAGEELDQDKLRELKDSLDDLRIVDVSRKPESISERLKAGEDFVTDQSDLLELISRGFGPTRTPDGELDILSTEGEIVCSMKDGVEYVLRFGNLELDSEGGDGEAGGGDEAGGAAADAGGDGESGDDAKGVNRYLFVLARFNEDAVEKPELEEVPELPEVAEADAQEDGADGESTEEPADDDVTDDDTADGRDGAGAENDGASDDEAEDDGEPSDLERAVAERKDVEERNARLLDEYQEKLESGRERVKELNARFGDWYYVISNDVFEKIHLGRDDLAKAKEGGDSEAGDAATGAGGDASAFGLPGTAVPGLPGLEAAIDRSEDPAGADEVESDDTPTTEEPGTADEPATTDTATANTDAADAPAEEPAPGETADE